MDEEIERLVIAVRADTAGFAKDVADMKAQLDGPLARGMERAGSALETGLSRAIRRGSLDFQDLKSVALSVMDDIASAAVNSGIGSLFGGGGSGGGLLGLGTSLLGAALGLPGRATGGPVTGGRAYMVGEQGPELFVPTAAGRIEPSAGTAPAQPNIRLTINISDHGQGSAPDQLRRSSRQVARAVRGALAYREG
ncbi:tail tape measure protein [Parasphingorhabdus cellanae]|uniref:Tail tape measure protein n=1 Tax=Parasphingorhabdus cellanae TaxID=2806553 RepID=A0ABX7TAL6_9SPHN|nr:tail tape measure protein [Parasphingorhabdus cellanae]QTD57555.1 tail tape measure protein [Parasphingorhabdus cellanae]